MKKRTQEIMRPELYEERSGIDADFDINASAADLSKISSDIVFADLKDRFDYQLNFSEETREYVKFKHNGKIIDVIPLGKMSKSGKYILKQKNGETLIVSIKQI